MRAEDSIGLLEYSIALSSPLPLAWLLSEGRVGTEVSSQIYGVIGLWVPPVILLALVFSPLSAGLYYLWRRLPVMVGLEFGLYLFPGLLGLPLKLVPGYTLGFLAYTVFLLLAGYLEWSSALIPGVSRRELGEVTLSALGEVLFSMAVGMAFFFLLFAQSSWAREPPQMFPFYLLLPFLAGATVAVVLAFQVEPGGNRKPPENPSRTFLVLRAYMTAGDSPRIERLGDNGWVTLELIGGSPLKRPILLKLEWDGEVPETITLRSPWETRVLTKKREWVKGDGRYVLFTAGW